MRRQLDQEGFRAIHAATPPWLQLTMELSLMTLQARKEVCDMRHADFRDSWLYVIRDKVAGDSSMAFITPALQQLSDLVGQYSRDGLVRKEADRLFQETAVRPFCSSLVKRLAES
jgi:hypothetical protein